MSSETEVIIIGAGSAGLSAAKELSRLGISHQVVEGSHRIGGRAYSEEIAPGEWFDLGCSWLVGGPDNPFTAIASELGVDLSTQNRERFWLPNLRFYRDGVRLDQAQFQACVQYFKASYSAISDVARQGRDVALSDVIDMEDISAPPFLTGIATSWGRDVDEVSTTDNESSEGDLAYQAYKGYGSLIAAWGRDVPVALNTRVNRIDWSQGTVRVETSRGNLRGKSVLLTVSTGVMGAHDIAFHPRLPDWKEEAIYNLPMGTENKIGVHFDSDVFGQDGRAFYTTWTSDGDAAKVDASMMGLNTATVFVGGRLGVWLEKQGPGALNAFAIDRLADIFGSAIRDRVARCIPTAWESEPWTRGSWACARPGHAHRRADLTRSVDARLFFAGEATHIGGQGTCHGAYLSGQRAAREIAQTVSACA
ncbi:MAG: NAD(P)/FAD-dependent oxidoreductase [Pseudomonadota bacterium]